MLKRKYDVFGSAELGDATFKGKYEFPYTRGVVLDAPPRRIVPFDRLGALQKGDWLHFYVHDCRFYRFLEMKDHYLKRMAGAAGFIGIDNSLYCDLPLAEQIHSCYLNRAVDYCLFKTGRPVVANVSWGDWRSYEFCFDGIASDCTVAMSSYGCCRSNKDKFKFEDGFVMAVERLRPRSVLFHGSIWPRLAELAEYHKIPLLKIPTQREIAYGRGCDMGKGLHGGFKNTQGRGSLHTLADNLPSVTSRFPLAPCGMFGTKGNGARIIKSSAPVGTAYEFFNRISAGYDKIIEIPYKDGSKKGCIAVLKDGTRITIRKKSSSDGSPAVDINITSPGRVKPHKIHFVKED